MLKKNVALSSFITTCLTLWSFSSIFCNGLTARKAPRGSNGPLKCLRRSYLRNVLYLLGCVFLFLQRPRFDFALHFFLPRQNQCISLTYIQLHPYNVTTKYLALMTNNDAFPYFFSATSLLKNSVTLHVSHAVWSAKTPNESFFDWFSMNNDICLNMYYQHVARFEQKNCMLVFSLIKNWNVFF